VLLFGRLDGGRDPAAERIRWLCFLTGRWNFRTSALQRRNKLAEFKEEQSVKLTSETEHLSLILHLLADFGMHA
jgi:hypothetical protein